MILTLDVYTVEAATGYGIDRALARPTENCVQAVACNVLTAAMLQLHGDGVPIVATIHDEVVAKVPVEQAELIQCHMLRVMGRPPVWAKDLPLVAEGYVDRRFIKPPKEHKETAL
jgi:hypothetical protein